MADTRNNDRHGRLSAALRENLKRRKAQLRGRAGSPPPQAPDAVDDDAASEGARHDEPKTRT